MLAETVIAKEDVFTAHVTEHGVRPMEHGRLDKGERRLPEIEGIPRLDRYIFPILVVVAFQNFNAVRRAVDRRIRDLPHQGGQRTRWVEYSSPWNRLSSQSILPTQETFSVSFLAIERSSFLFRFVDSITRFPQKIMDNFLIILISYNLRILEPPP